MDVMCFVVIIGERIEVTIIRVRKPLLSGALNRAK